MGAPSRHRRGGPRRLARRPAPPHAAGGRPAGLVALAPRPYRTVLVRGGRHAETRPPFAVAARRARRRLLHVGPPRLPLVGPALARAPARLHRALRAARRHVQPDRHLPGVRQHLDHLEQLGVGAIELLPLNTFPGRRGWGYDGVAWFAPHPAYGTPDDLKALIDDCHGRGMAVVVDAVYNHVGPAGNHLWAYGPYFTDRHHTPWGQGLNVDGPDSDEVRRFVLDNAVMWLRDYHVDGLRLDAVHAIIDHSAVHLLEELAATVAELTTLVDRELWLIAESDSNDPRLVRSRDAHGFGLDAQWADDLHHAVHVALTGERDGYYADFTGLPDVAKAWHGVFVRDGVYAPSMRRRHGRAVGELPPRRFVTSLQNHDQIGNRARGDRIGQLVGPARQKIGAALVLLAPTVPMLFQGEEWAASTPFQYFTDHTDPALADAVRDGRRREFAAFGWRPEDVPDPQAAATFEASTLRWDERHHGVHADMADWYRTLLELRRRFPAGAASLLGGLGVLGGLGGLGEGVDRHRVEVAAIDDRRLHARLGVLQLLVNLGRGDATFELDRLPGAGVALLAASGAVALDGGEARLGPDSVAVLGPDRVAAAETATGTTP
ncbi:MAG: malto-oligosyltrehalose trehalohydrolase [Acidimicrobiales bacterium]